MNVQPLNTHTPVHAYLTADKEPICVWEQKSRWEQCKLCERKVCAKCLWFGSYDWCKDCAQERLGRVYEEEYNVMIDPILTAISGKISWEIAHIIADYSMG